MSQFKIVEERPITDASQLEVINKLITPILTLRRQQMDIETQLNVYLGQLRPVTDYFKQQNRLPADQNWELSADGTKWLRFETEQPAAEPQPAESAPVS